MTHNQHLKTYLSLVQAQISACTLEKTERMTRASYAGWQNRYHHAIATARMLRAFLKLDSAMDKMIRAENEQFVLDCMYGEY